MNRYVFGMHRGGSTIMGAIARSAAGVTGVPFVDLGDASATLPEAGPRGAALRSDVLRDAAGKEIDGLYTPQPDNWRAHHGLFAPIRRADLFPVEVFTPADRAVLVIRDPRDCMVSGYYGFLRLHGGGMDHPGRKRQFDRGINAYVLDHMLPRYARALSDYVALRAAIPTLTVLPYEMMITDFPRWIAAFMTALDMPDQVRLRDRLRQFSLRPSATRLVHDLHCQDFERPDAEDIDSHKRQMLPGDHLRKLAPATIATINAQIGDDLRVFGYV